MGASKPATKRAAGLAKPKPKAAGRARGRKAGGFGGGPAAENLVPCPHCHRTFNEEAAKRHIPRCANTKAKPSLLKRGEGKAAFKNQLPQKPPAERGGATTAAA